ncbi:MAG: hypothetical protein JSS82_12625 [Bacteroidetes bacterium]|nr:hypothetical protein [Bacteroidota bacterium]
MITHYFCVKTTDIFFMDDDLDLSMSDMSMLCWEQRMNNEHPIHAEARFKFRDPRDMMGLFLEVLQKNRMLYCAAYKGGDTFWGMVHSKHTTWDDRNVIYDHIGNWAYLRSSLSGLSDDLAQRSKWNKDMFILAPNADRRKNFRISSADFSEKIISTTGHADISSFVYTPNRRLHSYPLFFNMDRNDIMVVIMWLFRKVMIHPIISMNVLLNESAQPGNRPLNDTDLGFGEMHFQSLVDLMQDTSSGTRDLIAMAYVFFRYNLRSFSTAETFDEREFLQIQNYVSNSLCEPLTQLLNIHCSPLLRKTVRVHGCFWVEDLYRWVKLEQKGVVSAFVQAHGTRRIPIQPLSSFFIGDETIGEEREKFYHLKLNVMNVAKFFRMLYPEDEYLYKLKNFSDVRGIIFQEGMPLPWYTEPYYESSSPSFMEEIHNYCAKCRQFVLDHYPNVYIGSKSLIYATRNE